MFKLILLSLITLTQSSVVDVDWVGASWWPDCREYSAFVYNLLSTKPDINAIVNFAFWPTQGQEKTLTKCSNNQTAPFDSYLCEIDHYEACTLEHLDCIGGCNDAAKQMQLFTCLNCFEGNHSSHPQNSDFPSSKSWMPYLTPCAKLAQLDHKAISKCSTDITKGSKLHTAYKKITTYIASLPLKYYPWVEVNNEEIKDGYDTCLLHSICGNYTSLPKPKSCTDMPKPPVGC